MWGKVFGSNWNNFRPRGKTTHKINNLGAYGKLLAFVNLCRSGGCGPLSDDTYYELIDAIHALGDQSARPRTVAAVLGTSVTDFVAETLLQTYGVTSIDQNTTELRDSCSIETLENFIDNITDDVEVQALLSRGTRGSTVPPLQATDDSGRSRFRISITCELDFQQAGSVKDEQRRALDDVNFDGRPYTTEMGAHKYVRDMKLLLHMFTSPVNFKSRCNLAPGPLCQWMEAICGQYKANVPYHNWCHALETAQMCYYQVAVCRGTNWLNAHDVLALLIAAISHDAAHVGYTNPFLTRTSHDLALIYNDKSPLENKSAYCCFETMRRPGHDFLPDHTRAAFREKVISAILSTDMSGHFNFVDRFRAKVSQWQHESYLQPADNKVDHDSSDRRLCISAYLQMADIGSNLKSFNAQLLAVHRLEAEWFAQGDHERELGIPISPNCDRQKDSAARIQSFFLGSMVRPLLEPFGLLTSEAYAGTAAGNLERNIQQWEVAVNRYGCQPVSELLPLLMKEEDESLRGLQFEV